MECEGMHAPVDVPSPLRQLLERSLRPDPGERPSLVELVDGLRRYGAAPR